jgi:hypothetical protein
VGTAKVRGSRTRHHTLWVGVWVRNKPGSSAHPCFLTIKICSRARFATRVPPSKRNRPRARQAGRLYRQSCQIQRIAAQESVLNAILKQPTRRARARFARNGSRRALRSAR